MLPPAPLLLQKELGPGLFSDPMKSVSWFDILHPKAIAFSSIHHPNVGYWCTGETPDRGSSTVSSALFLTEWQLLSNALGKTKQL